MKKSKQIFRVDEMINICKDKMVLNIGFINHSYLYEENIQKDDWVHQQLADVAKSIVGVDYLKEDVEKIKSKFGFEAYWADAMKIDELNLLKKFDVIVCGELIEHVENPGLMLKGIKKFMHENSILLITTPNPWTIWRVAQMIRGNAETNWLNPEHVSWFSFSTLSNILIRCGYEIIISDYYYFFGSRKQYNSVPSGLIGKLKFLKRKLMMVTPKRLQSGLFFTVKLAI